VIDIDDHHHCSKHRCPQPGDYDVDEWSCYGYAELRIVVATPLRKALLKRTKGKEPTDLLFPSSRTGGVHCKNWLKDNVKKICREVGVPEITAHGLRGTQATLAKEAGQTAHAVAAQLGHASPRTTREHYDAPGTEDRLKTRKMLKVLEGGKKDDPKSGNSPGRLAGNETLAGNVTKSAK